MQGGAEKSSQEGEHFHLLSSVQARQKRRNYENPVNTPDALSGSQGGLQVIRGTHLSYHSQTAASAERTQDVQ